MQSNGSDSQPQQPTEQNQQQRQQQTPTQPQPVALPQQWVPMQYPAAAMVMQHPMLPPQHYAPPPPQPYMPYHQYQQQVAHVAPHHAHQQHQGQGSSAENKTIWIGDLHHWMDENYLHRCFASTGEVLLLFFFFFSNSSLFYIYICIIFSIYIKRSHTLHISAFFCLLFCYVVDFMNVFFLKKKKTVLFLVYFSFRKLNF